LFFGQEFVESCGGEGERQRPLYTSNYSSETLIWFMPTHHQVIASSSPMSSSHGNANIVGVHFRVGKKIGEGSFGVIFEGTCMSLLKATLSIILSSLDD
jgi:hypothetical protein